MLIKLSWVGGESISSMIAIAEAAGAEVDLIIFGTARPSRAVDEDAFEAMVGALCAALEQGGYDGLLLEMHGAMVATHLDDGEGEILRRIHRIAPDLRCRCARFSCKSLSGDRCRVERARRLQDLPPRRYP